jgi:NitT/TauT family transport system substrate-binding protein
MGKRFLFLLLVLTMLLAACGGAATEAPAPEEPAAPVEEEAAPVEEEAAPVEEEEPMEEEPMEMRDVAIGAGTFVLNLTYPFLNLPRAEELGYWADMGYNVTVDAVGSSTDALQQLIGGNYDFVWIGGSVVLQGAAQENLPLRMVQLSTVVDWGLAVPSDSGIESVAELAGANIGVFSLGSSGIPLLKALLAENDIDPETGVELIPVGFGPQASQAVTSGDVDAVMLWGAALAQLENLGHELTIFRKADWSVMADVGLATTQDIIDEHPQMVEDIVRGMNMGSAFALASPECTARVQWANWPDTKPVDMDDDAALAWDLHLLEAQLESLNKATALHGVLGQAGPEELGLLQDFLLEQGNLTAEIDPSEVVILDDTFWDRVNDFDTDAIAAQAEACDF